MILEIREIRGDPLAQWQHGSATVDDVVGEAEALVADGFGLDAVVIHIEVHDVVGIGDPFGEISVALGDGGFVVVDIDSGAVFFGVLDVEHGVEGEEDGQPEVVAGGFDILGVFVTLFVMIELPVILEGLLGIINVAVGFGKGVDDRF